MYWINDYARGSGHVFYGSLFYSLAEVMAVIGIAFLLVSGLPQLSFHFVLLYYILLYLITFYFILFYYILFYYIIDDHCDTFFLIINSQKWGMMRHEVTCDMI